MLQPEDQNLFSFADVSEHWGLDSNNALEERLEAGRIFCTVKVTGECFVGRVEPDEDITKAVNIGSRTGGYNEFEPAKNEYLIARYGGTALASDNDLLDLRTEDLLQQDDDGTWLVYTFRHVDHAVRKADLRISRAEVERFDLAQIQAPEEMHEDQDYLHEWQTVLLAQSQVSEETHEDYLNRRLLEGAKREVIALKIYERGGNDFDIGLADRPRGAGDEDPTVRKRGLRFREKRGLPTKHPSNRKTGSKKSPKKISK